MTRIAEFEKVSLTQYRKDAPEKELFNPDEAYENIILPKRATKGSAGYDFYSPSEIHLLPNETTLVPTGVRVKIENGWFLGMFPRSGLGFKYRLRLDNTVGIIDSDYYNSDNEGHIMIKMTNEGEKELYIKTGDRIAQGIFIPFSITYSDDADGVRNGGFSSTGN